MNAQIRPYDRDRDFDRVSRLLIDVHEPGDVFHNWLQPRWEYMHFHPYIEHVPLDLMAVAESDGEIVGVANLEHSATFGFFQVRPGWDWVKPELFAHAEKHFGGWSHSFRRNIIGLFIHELDEEMTSLAIEAGFAEHPEHADFQAKLDLTSGIDVPPIPHGFRIQSLDEENDLVKIDRCLHRGFDHAGDPPADGPAQRAFMQSAPNFRKDLTIVAVSPNDDYVGFGGMWVVPENRIAYVEPVATDPAYRMIGLGKAVVLETLRRAAADGAEVAWVGSNQAFYTSMGFDVRFAFRLWVRDL